MADYAGAVAAINARFLAQWVNGSARKTPVAFANEPPNDGVDEISPWPPVDGAGSPVPWVYFEVIGSGSEVRGVGTPGNNVWIYRGGIFIHVFVPEGSSVETAHGLVIAAGEIFRAATFYQDGQGAKVISMSPQTDGGSSDADNGNQFRVTCFVPFEYFHHG
jgi:hypothetical protein